MILMLKYIHIFAVVGIMAFMPATEGLSAVPVKSVSWAML